MSLNWQWYDKMGEVIYDDGHTDTLYQGNALMIAVYHYETADGSKYYQLTWFASDKEHLKNLLGLGKTDKTNYLAHHGVKSLRLNTRYKSVPKIVETLAKAKTNITIELYFSEEDDE